MAASVISLLLLVNTSPPALVTDLRDLIHVIARTYFSTVRCVVYVTDEPDDIATPSGNPATAAVIVAGNASILRSAYDEACAGFVVRTSAERRSSTVRDLIDAYKESQYARYNDKRYLFLPVNADDTDATFLESRDMYYMPNLVFVSPVANASRTYDIVTHNFFHGYKYDVQGLKHEVVDTWKSGRGFERGVDLYPDRMRNLNGKMLRFSLLHYSPYAFVLNGSDGEVVYDGLETKVAAQFVEASNGTWTGLDNPVDLWGELFGNGSGTGVFGTVLENKADLGFSAIYQWYCDVLECSRPYIHSDVTCLAPKPEVVSGYLTIILPFESEAWIAFTTCFIFSGLFAFFVQVTWAWIRGMRDRTRINLFGAFYDVFRLQLEQTPRSASNKTPVSDYYKIWGVYTFLIAVCWQGGISSFLTVPRYENPINDATDLAEKFPRVRWGANHIAWVESIKQSTDPVLMKIVKEFIVADAATLKSHASKKDFAYFMETLQYEHYALNTYIDEEGMKHLRIMEKNVYGGYVVMILTRGSPYQRRLDEVLLRMFDTGLVLKTGAQVVLERIDMKLQNMVRSSVEKPTQVPTTLRVTHIQGALYIYALGIVVSMVAFLAEVSCFCTKSRSNGSSHLKTFF